MHTGNDFDQDQEGEEGAEGEEGEEDEDLEGFGEEGDEDIEGAGDEYDDEQRQQDHDHFASDVTPQNTTASGAAPVRSHASGSSLTHSATHTPAM